MSLIESPTSSLFEAALLREFHFPGLLYQVAFFSFVDSQREFLQQSLVTLRRNAADSFSSQCVYLSVLPGRAAMWLSACPSNAMHLQEASVKGLRSGRTQVDA